MRGEAMEAGSEAKSRSGSLNFLTTVAEHGGQLKLPSLTQKVRDVPAITRLLTVFQVFDSEPATVASFA